jgi:hypothetical protein
LFPFGIVVVIWFFAQRIYGADNFQVSYLRIVCFFVDDYNRRRSVNQISLGSLFFFFFLEFLLFRAQKIGRDIVRVLNLEELLCCI